MKKKNPKIVKFKFSLSYDSNPGKYLNYIKVNV